MGTGDGTAVVVPRLESWTAVLRAHHYPEALWPWLIRGGRMIHGLVHKIDKVRWHDETGHTMTDCPTEVLYGGL